MSRRRCHSEETAAANTTAAAATGRTGAAGGHGTPHDEPSVESTVQLGATKVDSNERPTVMAEENTGAAEAAAAAPTEARDTALLTFLQSSYVTGEVPSFPVLVPPADAAVGEMLRFLLLHAGSESDAPVAASAALTATAAASSFAQSSASSSPRLAASDTSSPPASTAAAASALVRMSWFRRELSLLPSLLWLTFYAPSSRMWATFFRTISRAKAMQYIDFTRPPHSSLPVHMGIWNMGLQDRLTRYKRSNETANESKPDQAITNTQSRSRKSAKEREEKEEMHPAATMVPYTSEKDAPVDSAKKDVAAATAETVARMAAKRPKHEAAAAITTNVAAIASAAATDSNFSLSAADPPASSSSSFLSCSTAALPKFRQANPSSCALSSLLPKSRVQGRQSDTEIGSLVSAVSPSYLPYSEHRWRQFACFLAFKFYRDQLDQQLTLLQRATTTGAAACASGSDKDDSHASMPVSTSPAAAASSASCASSPLPPTADFPSLSCTCGVMSSPLSARRVSSVLQCIRPCLSRLLSFLHSSLRCTLFLQPESPPFPLFLFALPHMSEQQMLMRNRPLRKCMQILRLCNSMQDLQYHAASDSGRIVQRSYRPREKAHILGERVADEEATSDSDTDVDVDNSNNQAKPKGTRKVSKGIRSKMQARVGSNK